MSEVEVNGYCESSFEAVKAAFSSLFTDFPEQGASCSVYHRGRPVVNLWAGHSDKSTVQPWQEDALVNVFSTSKAVTSLCVQKAIDLGLLDIERPASYYWSEYGCNGKKSTLVKWMLNHQSAQPAIRAPLPDEALYDWDRMCDALAKEEPWWEPGKSHGYHMMTFGWLVGEVFRRAVGISVGEFLQQEMAGPLSLDMMFGVSDENLSRIVHLLPPNTQTEPGRVSLFAKMMTQRESITTRALTNPASIMTGSNTTEWRQAEIPSANLHATAHSLATLFGKVACREGVVSDDAVTRCMQQLSYGDDPVLHTTSRFGPGFMLQQLGDEEAEFGKGPNAFGHPGSGGSLVFADPDQELGFAYVMNQMGPYVLIDPRARRLADAVYSCLKKNH